MNELDLELKGLVRWQRFALQLPMIERSDIEEIEQDNQGSTEKQRLALFGTWLRRCISASWQDVVIALEKINENVLAADINLKYNLVGSTSPDNTSTVPQSHACPLNPPLPDSLSYRDHGENVQ